MVESQNGEAADGLPNELRTGFEKIDADHRELFARVDRVRAAARDEQLAAEVVRDHIAFFSAYAEHHFARELELMRKYAYPDQEVHLADHDEFRSAVAAFKETLTREQDPRAAAERIAAALEQWLEVHIADRDRALAAFLRDRAD